MAQTVNGKNTSQKQNRPGQRQQERLQRLARRRRRRQIWTSIILTIVILVMAGVSFWQYQRYTDAQNALASAHATATTTTRVNATATAITQNCFMVPAGSKTDNYYSAIATATPTAGLDSSPHYTGQVVTQPDGLKYIDIVVGTGAVAKSNSSITAQYSGWFAENCKKFDSSYDHGGKAFPVTLGQGQVIKGWDEGVVGMKVGGIRRLYLPPSLAYGAQGSPPTVPANSTLIFDVTLVSVS